ncbi:MAG TPA: carbohydrate ABC transporter permease, partial [Clostridia bacterium]|nr:carbohydrate ABC transporter permease [Clostridia bacterium]
LLFIIKASVSGGTSVLSLSLLPRNFTWVSYEAVFKYRDIWIGYQNSLVLAFVGTFLSLAVTVCCAYPLSRADFKGGGVVMLLCMITMYFSGGLIPTYLVVRELYLTNTLWSLILPGVMSVYNMIVMRTYFKSQIPPEMLESAQLDGCNNIRYLLSIVLPLSGSILAVIGLFYAVGYWNSYFSAMIYITDRNGYPLSLVLRELLVLSRETDLTGMVSLDDSMSLEARRNLMKYAVIVVSSLPVMLLYPLIQKYFVKGVMVGAVKG